MRKRLGFLVVAALIASGCAVNSGHGSSTHRNCSEVWVKGHVLADDYRGCARDNGDVVVPDSTPCEDAKGKSLVTFGADGGTYAAIRGGKIDFLEGSRNGTRIWNGISC